MDDPLQQTRCPNCGSPVASGARFCSSCGLSFTSMAPIVATGLITPPGTPVGGVPFVPFGTPSSGVPLVPTSASKDETALVEIRRAVEGRYAVERELGRGGMATVYLATDVKHERQVAIKVLLPDLSASIGAERFEREIRVAAKLQHPHILGLFDSGVSNGLVYYVMPFVSGESLRARLDREGMLPVDDAIAIALEVGDALGYAHEQGIVHRDIKPENILLQNGHALVADFGIARAVTEAGAQKLTQTGMAVGTPVYMAPEQSMGEVVGPTADIYSLGCMLYEMLAGEPPFTGRNAAQIMARHAMEGVPSIRIVRSAVPEEVEEAIFAAMGKQPADRPQTAIAFAQLLGLPAGGATGSIRVMRHTASRRVPTGVQMALVPPPTARPRRFWFLVGGAIALIAVGSVVVSRVWGSGARSGGAADPLAGKVAVRYFSVAGGDSAELQPVADRLTESLIADLSAVRGLTMASINGVSQVRKAAVSRDSAARLLKVGTIVEGTIETEGAAKVRITARLYDASGANLGSPKTVLVARDSLFSAEEAVAREVSTALRELIGPEIEVRQSRAGTRSMAAWTLFNRAERARKDAANFGADRADAALARLAQADSLFRAASEADGKWVDPRLERAQVALDERRLGPEAAVARLLDTAQVRIAEVLALDPGSARALELRGTLKYVRWRAGRSALDPATRSALLLDAETDLLAAIRKDDRLVSAYATMSALYYDKKDVPASLLKAQTAYQADEFLANSQAILARLFFGSYDTQLFADAEKWCREGGRRFPGDITFTECQLWLQLAPDAKPDPVAAWRLVARLDSLSPPPAGAFEGLLARMIVGGIIGRHARALAAGPQQAAMLDSARRVLERSEGDRAVDPSHELPGYRAVMLAQIGDLDAAIALLTTYVAANPDHSFRVGGNVHWWWRELRNKKGFEALLSRTR